MAITGNPRIFAKKRFNSDTLAMPRLSISKRIRQRLGLSSICTLAQEVTAFTGIYADWKVLNTAPERAALAVIIRTF